MRRIVRIEQPHGVHPLFAVAAAQILQRNSVRVFRISMILRLTLPRQDGSRITAIPVGARAPLPIFNTIIFDLSERPALMRHLHLNLASDHNFVDVASQMWPENGERRHHCRNIDL